MNETLVVFDDRQKFVVGLWLRVVAAGMFLFMLAPMTLFGVDFPWSQCFPAYIGLVALIGLNGLYWLVGKQWGFPLSQFYIHWAIDLLLISVVLYGLGGALLPSAITGYLLIVITSAVFISQRASYAVATGTAVAYGGSIAAEIFELIDPMYDLALPRMSPGMTMLVVGAPISVAYLVAFITGTIGDQLNALNKLLQKRNDELRERNESLDKMQSELDFHSKVLAHDVRSPVAAANGALSALKRQNAGRLVDEDLLDIALQNLGRAEDMIDAVHQAREGMDTGEHRELVAIDQLIAELHVELDHQLAASKVRLEVCGDLPVLKAVKSRLTVMFRNLISNAIRYAPTDGSGRVEVGVTESEQEWRLFVRDNGCGVQPEYREMIFEMFRKAPQKQRSPGMGLGLALVRKVAEGHGGQVWVESDGKTGSTFWVSLPRDTGRTT